MTWACPVPVLTHWLLRARARGSYGIRQVRARVVSGRGGATYLSIMDLKSNTPSMSLAANLGDEAES